MRGNAPPFDPLHPCPVEAEDMFSGYRDGMAGKPLPALATLAYEHGHRNARNDLAGRADPEQLELARRQREEAGRRA